MLWREVRSFGIRDLILRRLSSLITPTQLENDFIYFDNYHCPRYSFLIDLTTYTQLIGRASTSLNL
jgi:hypothetical protein